MREYLLTLVVAATVTYLLTPVARRIALRWGAMTPVRDRDVHAIPTPRLGGIAMLAGFGAGMLVATQMPFLGPRLGDNRQTMALMAGAVLICLLGVADDKWELDALTKLAGQVLAAGVMVLGGIQMLYLPIGNLGGESADGVSNAFVLGPVEGTVLTIVLVVVTVNAVNFVDGLDGLAAGIVGIAASSFFVFSYILTVNESLTRATLPGVIAAALIGVCLGFLPHNFSPARIFMGDSGSMLIGLLLASTTITLTGTVDAQRRQHRPGPRPAAAGAADRRDGPAVPRRAARDLPPHARRTVAVRAGQAAPAPPAAGARAQPRPRRARDVPLVGRDRLRGHRGRLPERHGVVRQPGRRDLGGDPRHDEHPPDASVGGHVHRPATGEGPMTVRRGVGVRALLGPAVLVALAVAVVCGVAGSVVAGVSGLAAAAVGAGLVLGFLLVGQLPIVQAARGRRGLGAVLLLFGYSAQVLLLVVVLAVVTTSGTPDPTVLGLTVIAVALGWTAGTVWSWLRWRGPVVDVDVPDDRGTRAR